MNSSAAVSVESIANAGLSAGFDVGESRFSDEPKKIKNYKLKHVFDFFFRKGQKSFDAAYDQVISTTRSYLEVVNFH